MRNHFYSGRIQCIKRFIQNKQIRFFHNSCRYPKTLFHSQRIFFIFSLVIRIKPYSEKSISYFLFRNFLIDICNHF